jgi:hypothetical protein
VYVALGLKLRVYTLSHSTSPFFDGFFEIRSLNYPKWGRLALNFDPPDLCFLSS